MQYAALFANPFVWNDWFFPLEGHLPNSCCCLRKPMFVPGSTPADRMGVREAAGNLRLT